MTLKEPIDMTKSEIWENRYEISSRTSLLRSIYKDTDLKRFYSVLSDSYLNELLGQLTHYNKDYSNQKKILSVREELYRRELFLTQIIYEEPIKGPFSYDPYKAIDMLELCVKNKLEKSLSFILNNCSFMIDRNGINKTSVIFDNLCHVEEKKAREIVSCITVGDWAHEIATRLINKPEQFKMFVECGYNLQGLLDDSYKSSKLFNFHSLESKKLFWLQESFQVNLDKYLINNKVVPLMIEYNHSEEDIIDIIKKYPHTLTQTHKITRPTNSIKVDDFLSYSLYYLSIIHQKEKVARYLNNIAPRALVFYGYDSSKEINTVEKLTNSFVVSVYSVLKILQHRPEELGEWVIKYLEERLYPNYRELQSDVQKLVCYYIENIRNFNEEKMKELLRYGEIDKSIINASIERRKLADNIHIRAKGRISKI